MGYSNWSQSAYSNLRQKRTSASRGQIFKNTGRVDPTMNPHGIKVRESRDSAAHPDSNAIIVAFDVTGSMGKIPEQFARQELGGLMRMLVENKYIVDPQVLFAAIGDGYTDQGPFQVGQFESGLEMDMWLTRMWLEGGGGGQKRESYGFAHWFASRHTSVDCWEKRQKKGYLFTMGDEMPWDLPAPQIERLFGYSPERDYTMEEVIEEASKSWEIFHIHVAEGYHGKDPTVVEAWREVLGERVLILPDADGICELIGTTIGLLESSIDLRQARQDLSAMGASGQTVDKVMSALTPIASNTALIKPSVAAGALAPASSDDDAVERL